MTLPAERTRAVIWAEDFLTRLISPYNKNGIKKIPKAVRQEALYILRHFPRPYELESVATNNPEVFDAATIEQHFQKEE